MREVEWSEVYYYATATHGPGSHTHRDHNTAPPHNAMLMLTPHASCPHCSCLTHSDVPLSGFLPMAGEERDALFRDSIAALVKALQAASPNSAGGSA